MTRADVIAVLRAVIDARRCSGWTDEDLRVEIAAVGLLAADEDAAAVERARIAQRLRAMTPYNRATYGMQTEPDGAWLPRDYVLEVCAAPASERIY